MLSPLKTANTWEISLEGFQKEAIEAISFPKKTFREQEENLILIPWWS